MMMAIARIKVRVVSILFVDFGRVSSKEMMNRSSAGVCIHR